MGMMFWLKILTLTVLYFLQGLPFGFQTGTFPLLLRQRNVARTVIGLASILSVPWVLKPLWAPLVDSFPSGRAPVARLRAWMHPLQLLLFVLVVCMRLTSNNVSGLSIIILLVSFVTATFDIAVDGLALEILESDELGYGNAAQVVGFKLGYMVGGGALVWLTNEVWTHLFEAMACIVLSLSAVSFLLLNLDIPRAPAPGKERAPPSRSGAAPSRGGLATVTNVCKTLYETVNRPNQLWVLIGILTYKAGEIVGDRMFKIFLMDAKFSAAEISVTATMLGTTFSILGSTFGGYYCSLVYTAPHLAMPSLSLMNIVAQGLRLLVTLVPVDYIRNILGIAVCVENFVGGALTTAMFAFMMEQVNHEIGATHISLLAAIEVLGKSLPSLMSGLLVDLWGYPAVFGGTVVMTAIFYLVSLQLRKIHSSATVSPPMTPTKHD